MAAQEVERLPTLTTGLGVGNDNTMAAEMAQGESAASPFAAGAKRTLHEILAEAAHVDPSASSTYQLTSLDPTPSTKDLLKRNPAYTPSEPLDPNSVGIVPKGLLESVDADEFLRKAAHQPIVTFDDHTPESWVYPIVVLITHLSYITLTVFGHIRDFFGKFLRPQGYNHLKEEGYAPLYSDFESFYTRRIYIRTRDCFNRPITGVAGARLTLLERVTKDYNKTFQLTGRTREVINMGSYNYLGFAQNEGRCADEVELSLRAHGVSYNSPRAEAGTHALHVELEKLTAEFVGTEDAIVCSMGFATNSTIIPALMGKGCLIVSDELNHASIINGCRNSGSTTRVFKHNCAADLERVLRQAIASGQPRTHRPWRKIMIIVEGIYSMEGSVCDLPRIVELKKKYKCYLYVDEAHSIGALGPRGRGICDYWAVPTTDVDILMGTFTKSFGAAGGYVASSKAIIDTIRARAHSSIYSETMPPPVCQQVISSLSIIMGRDGTNDGLDRIKKLRDNSMYLRRRLVDAGFVVYGDEDTPVIPVLLYNPSNVRHIGTSFLKRGIAVVVVGFPATPLVTSRMRICISSAHTREDLDKTFDALIEESTETMIRLNYKAT
ncbi:serine palmitoyltransferase [Fonticula alba]|uniref:serine C-palmitoyltransferase n=1 Tax=Fonticula alba TaxID=691883 RepID=A0A058ZBD5_FONAL|nr:serine palmitoyltransferase [Fonticula alba]KCV71735.1 serine palmitoyltransferase [Fonticula alba]|eukprot:XP_009493313.1 serine palmitoyltransferase [Fonticula alba]